jgi:hypothetical protein
MLAILLLSGSTSSYQSFCRTVPQADTNFASELSTNGYHSFCQTFQQAVTNPAAKRFNSDIPLFYFIPFTLFTKVRRLSFPHPRSNSISLPRLVVRGAVLYESTVIES